MLLRGKAMALDSNVPDTPGERRAAGSAVTAPRTERNPPMDDRTAHLYGRQHAGRSWRGGRLVAESHVVAVSPDKLDRRTFV